MRLKLNQTYSQRDARWSNVLLGFNTAKPYTIGNFGCLITTLANYFSALGYEETPLSLNDKLKNCNGFTEGSGLLNWQKIFSIYPTIDYDYEFSTTEVLTDTQIKKMVSLVKEGHFLICEVDSNPALVGEQMHFVGVFGYTDELICFDPWTGKEVPLSVYGDPKKAVYSYRCYSKTLDILADEGEVVTGGSESGYSNDSKDDVIAGLKTQVTDLVGQIKVLNKRVEDRDITITTINDAYKKEVSNWTITEQGYKDAVELLGTQLDEEKSYNNKIKQGDAWSLIFLGIGKLFKKGGESK